MCAIPTLLANFDGNLLAQTRDSVVTLTSSGPVRYVDGSAPGSQAYVAEESTTNIVPNPWHAVDAAGWTGTTRDTSYAVQGPASGLITASGAGAEATIDVTASADTHTVQAIVRNNAASARTFQLRYNSTDAGNAVVVAAGAEQTITASVTGTGSSAALGVQVTDSEAAETYNVGYLGVEQKPYATSFCPQLDGSGNLLPGYTWAGTAHASASTRARSYASKPLSAFGVSPQRGSAVVRFRRLWGITSAGSYPIALGGLSGTTSPFYISVRMVGASMYIRDNLPSARFSTYAPEIGEDRTVYFSWDDDQLTVDWGDGSGLQVGPRNAYDGTWLTDSLTVGTTTAGGDLNGAIDGAAIFDRPLTDGEREYIMNAPTWEWDTLIPRFGGIHVSAPIEPIAVAVSVPVDVTGG